MSGAFPQEFSLLERQSEACRRWLLARGHAAPFDLHERLRAVDERYPGGYEQFLRDHGLSGRRPR